MVVLAIAVLCDSFVGDWMNNAVGGLFNVYIVVICQAAWACCDNVSVCPDGFVIPVVDVIRHQVDCLLQYHVDCHKRDS